MNEIKLFNFKQNNVSSLSFENQVYFFPEEIGEILGFGDLSNSIRTSFGLEEPQDFKVFRSDELKCIKNLMDVSRVGGSLELGENINSKLLLSESGLYILIMRSVKPEAPEFQRWITREVLPSIRKTGAYLTQSALDNWLANPDIMIKALTELKESRERERIEREKRIEAERTKALIGSKREATSMATASAAVRKLNKIEEGMDKDKEYATIKKVSIGLGISDIGFLAH